MSLGKVLSTRFLSFLFFLKVADCVLQHVNEECVVSLLCLDFIKQILILLDGCIIAVVHWAHQVEEWLGYESALILNDSLDLLEEFGVILLNISVVIDLIPPSECLPECMEGP